MVNGEEGSWPVLTRYSQQQLARIALPLGGIGTGTISLGGRGDLRDWEVVNRPAKGFVPKHSFFALHLQTVTGERVTRALEGQIEPPYEGADGSKTPNAGLPRFRQCEFEAAYPLGQVVLSDLDVPLKVRLQAFNPLIPTDAERSGLPVAVLRYVLENSGSEAVKATVCGSLQNFIGTDGSFGIAQANQNIFQQDSSGLTGLLLRSQGVPQDSEKWGTLALTTTAQQGISYRTAWANLSWGDSMLDFWDDLSEDGRLEERTQEGVDAPIASLAVQIDVPAHSTRRVTFLLSWHFPNRLTWTPTRSGTLEATQDRVGNYYTTRYSDAWDVAIQAATQLPELEQLTLRFIRSFCESDLPAVVKEAALYNLSTLRTQTCFRTEDGRFYGWEGCNDREGWCHGSCTHVWNYEQATPFLFGELARSMREVEFRYATDSNGLMSFRTNLPLERANDWHLAAADGQMGCIMKLYRDWQLSGDDTFLRDLWPQVRKALEFCWIPGGWDADQDGVMEGCQHNTMDVEYYGPNPQMGFWYLGALRAAEEMARYMGETAFAETCRTLHTHGSAWLDAHLFNGDYYEQHIQAPGNAALIADGLRLGAGSTNLTEPDLQLGAGCLVDQLVGQYMAHICGLGYLSEREHIQQTLQSILRYNFQEDFSAHFNHMRTYVINEEAGLLMCSFPHGKRPRRPFPYYNEVMTGFEYSAAVHMLYEGQIAEGLRCIEAIRARYDGRKRSPFNEAECGHHYARAMASWAAVLALSGFHYSGVERQMEFAPAEKPTTWFWSTGYAWGTCRIEPEERAYTLLLQVDYGRLPLQYLGIRGLTTPKLTAPLELLGGQNIYLYLPIE